MADNKIERSIVTTEAFKNFIDTFKKYVYDWTNPSNNGTDEKTTERNGIEGIVVATNKDIDDLFK